MTHLTIDRADRNTFPPPCSAACCHVHARYRTRFVTIIIRTHLNSGQRFAGRNSSLRYIFGRKSFCRQYAVVIVRTRRRLLCPVPAARGPSPARGGGGGQEPGASSFTSATAFLRRHCPRATVRSPTETEKLPSSLMRTGCGAPLGAPSWPNGPVILGRRSAVTVAAPR